MSNETKEQTKEPLIQFKGTTKKTNVMFEGKVDCSPTPPPKPPKIVRKKVHISSPPNIIKNIHTLNTSEKQYVYSFIESILAMIEERRSMLLEDFNTDDMLIDKLFWKEVEEYISQTLKDILEKKEKDAKRKTTRFEIDSNFGVRKVPVDSNENK